MTVHVHEHIFNRMFSDVKKCFIASLSFTLKWLASGSEMAQHYSDPSREADKWSLPDVETFQLTVREVAERDEDMVHEYMKRREFRLASMNSRAREAMFDAMIEEVARVRNGFWTRPASRGPFLFGRACELAKRSGHDCRDDGIVEILTGARFPLAPSNFWRMLLGARQVSRTLR